MKGVKGFQKGKNNPSFGKLPWNYGKATPDEVRQKSSDSHKGYQMPEKQKKKISDALKGKKKPPRSQEHRRKIGDSRRGEKSTFWIDGRSKEQYGYSNDWTDVLRESIRQRDNHICQQCGIHQDELNFGQVKRLDVHHIDYNRENLNSTNLISLCRKCHQKTNLNREYWMEYFGGFTGE